MFKEIWYNDEMQENVEFIIYSDEKEMKSYLKSLSVPKEAFPFKKGHNIGGFNLRSRNEKRVIIAILDRGDARYVADIMRHELFHYCFACSIAKTSVEYGADLYPSYYLKLLELIRKYDEQKNGKGGKE